MGEKKKERKKRGKTRCLFFKRAVELVSGRWRAEEQQQGVGLIANWLVVANKNSITGYPPPVIVENFGPGLFKPPPPLILPLSFLLFRLREPSLSLSLSFFKAFANIRSEKIFDVIRYRGSAADALAGPRDSASFPPSSPLPFDASVVLWISFSFVWMGMDATWCKRVNERHDIIFFSLSLLHTILEKGWEGLSIDFWESWWM